MLVFLQFVQNLCSYAVLQHMFTLFTCLTRFLVEFATQCKFRMGGTCRCYGNHPPKMIKICCFCAVMLPQLFCAHFSHTLNDSHLSLPDTRNSSLEVSAVVMATTPPKMVKIFCFLPLFPTPIVLGTLFRCLQRFTSKFATHSFFLIGVICCSYGKTFLTT